MIANLSVCLTLGKLLAINNPVTTAFQPKTVGKVFLELQPNQPKPFLVETLGPSRTTIACKTGKKEIERAVVVTTDSCFHFAKQSYNLIEFIKSGFYYCFTSK